HTPRREVPAGQAFGFDGRLLSAQRGWLLAGFARARRGRLLRRGFLGGALGRSLLGGGLLGGGLLRAGLLRGSLRGGLRGGTLLRGGFRGCLGRGLLRLRSRGRLLGPRRFVARHVSSSSCQYAYAIATPYV